MDETVEKVAAASSPRFQWRSNACLPEKCRLDQALIGYCKILSTQALAVLPRGYNMYRMVFFSRNHCPSCWEEKLIRGRTKLALYPLTISLHGAVIEIPRRLSLASSTGAIVGGMTPGSVTFGPVYG